MIKSKAGWREIGGKRCYFKSRWEANYARYLQYLKEKDLIAEWEYEPKTFWFDGIKRGVCSYKPDFRRTINETRVDWVEVKGYMDKRSQTKIKRFRNYYPNEILYVIDKRWFDSHENLYRNLKGWEE